MGLDRGTLRLLFITTLISLSFTAIAQQSPAPGAQRDARIAELERQVAELQREVAELREILQTFMGSGTEAPYMVASAEATRDTGAYYDPVTGLTIGFDASINLTHRGARVFITFPGEETKALEVSAGQTLYFVASGKSYKIIIKRAEYPRGVEFSIIEERE